jgi:hypothetical protein
MKIGNLNIELSPGDQGEVLVNKDGSVSEVRFWGRESRDVDEVSLDPASLERVEVEIPDAGDADGVALWSMAHPKKKLFGESAATNPEALRAGAEKTARLRGLVDGYGYEEWERGQKLRAGVTGAHSRNMRDTLDGDTNPLWRGGREDGENPAEDTNPERWRAASGMVGELRLHGYTVLAPGEVEKYRDAGVSPEASVALAVWLAGIGSVVVPREATEAMVRAGVKYLEKACSILVAPITVGSAWAAMVRAVSK